MKKVFSFVLALAAATTLAFADETKSVDCGSSVNIKAVPAAHYHFVKWSDDDINAERTVTVNEALTLIATFAEDTYYTLTLGNQISIISGESANGKYYPGDQVTVKAVPNAADQCEEFKNWADDPDNKTDLRTITFGSENVSLAAIFGAKQLNITIQAGEGGSVVFE